MSASGSLPTLNGDRTCLRARRPDDDVVLLSILQEPDVGRWWGKWSLERVKAELCTDECVGWVIEEQCETVGWLAAGPDLDPEYEHVSLDIFLSGSSRGKGLGREALRLAITHFREVGHHRFTIDPCVDNTAAIRAYAAVGFQPVGVMRQYERVHEDWHDCLLMDMLADELV